jgi:hypothetical protein
MILLYINDLKDKPEEMTFFENIRDFDIEAYSLIK